MGVVFIPVFPTSFGMIVRSLRRRLQGAEFPGIKEDDPEVVRLRDAVRRMPDALEKAFHLSEDPSQCTAAHMVVAEYLRGMGFDAEVTPALYTGRNYGAESGFGRTAGRRSRLYANLLGLSPVCRRNPKRFGQEKTRSEDQADYVYGHLYLAMDCFVRVRVGDGGTRGGYHFIHAAYRQFLPPDDANNAPPVILDRVDAYKLKRKYHLLVTSPEHVRRMRDAEGMVFSDAEAPGECEGVRLLRRHVLEGYAVFRGAMNSGGRA